MFNARRVLENDRRGVFALHDAKHVSQRGQFTLALTVSLLTVGCLNQSSLRSISSSQFSARSASITFAKSSSIDAGLE